MRAGLFPSLFRTPAQRSEERQAVERAMRELAFVGLDDQYANLAAVLPRRDTYCVCSGTEGVDTLYT